MKNFINTGGRHAFPCVIPPTAKLTISKNQFATPPYNISNTLVRSEITGDLLKTTFHPQKDLHELLYAPLTSRIICGSLSLFIWLCCLQDSKDKDTVFCNMNEPAVSVSGMLCKPRQVISCHNLSEPFYHTPSSLNNPTSCQ